MECEEFAGRGLFSIGTISLKVPACSNNATYVLRFVLTGENVKAIENEYDIFVYEENVTKKRLFLKIRDQKRKKQMLRRLLRHKDLILIMRTYVSQMITRPL